MNERMIERLDKIAARALKLRDNAVDENRDLTESEAKEIDVLLADHERLSAAAQQFDKVENMAAKGHELMPRVVPPQPISNAGGPTSYGEGARTFNDMFQRPQGQKAGGFESFGHFARTVMLAPNDSRLRNDAMKEGVGADGGFAVPLQYVGALLDRSIEREVIRPRAFVIPMTSNQATLPLFDYMDNTGATRAGLQLKWMGELETNVPQKAKLKALTLVAKKGAIFVDASSELTEDMPLFDRRISAAMSSAIAAGLDFAFMQGNGVGRPLGLVNAPGTVIVAKTAGQTADTISEANIVAMAARLDASSWRNAVWLVHPTALAQLLTLSQATGPNGGARTVLLRESDSGLSLLTLPVIVTDATNTLGDKGDIVLADLSHYVIGLRKEATLEVSTGPGWYEDRIGFRFILRVTGQPENDVQTTLRDGINSTGTTVVLAERA